MSERAAPYPADTRAKGWRFELDLERIKQSDTWALAAPDVRPWLLMLWAESWGQVPCGSLPADDALIAARIGMAPKAFTKARSMLMRGWWLATDGRLYHDTIATRVLSMLDAKRKEADRKSAYRARMDAERIVSPTGVPRDSAETTTGLTQPSTGCDDTGTSTGTRRKEEEKGSRKRSPSFRAEAIELPDWLDRELWETWCKERRTRGKPITELAAKEQLKSLDEYRRNGQTPARVISHAIASGNQGLYPAPVIRGAVAPGTVSSTAAEKTQEYLRAQEQTPEQRAAAEAARRDVMAKLRPAIKVMS